DRDVFIERYGHRCSQEMELARPRWSEDPAAVDRLVAETRSALEREQAAHAKSSAAAAWERIVAEAKLNPYQAAALDREVNNLHTYLCLRESGKHYLLQGYALIRRALVELDRRFELDGGVFFLTPEELPEAGTGAVRARIAQRRRRRDLGLRIPMP